MPMSSESHGSPRRTTARRRVVSPLERAYAGRGSKAYHPGMLLALLFYGYATGIFSSRKLEAATYDSIAFRFICANTHPDHDTIATFRRRFLPQLEPLFTAILVLAAEMGFLKLGTVSLDGSRYARSEDEIESSRIPVASPDENPEQLLEARELGREIEAAIGRQVRKLRLRLGVTVAGFARQSGLSAGMLSKIENGATSPSLAALPASSIGRSL